MTLPPTTYTAYTWVNKLYMNEKQWGIQTTHCISDMSLLDNEIYKKWAKEFKTVIMFDGTNCGTLRRVHTILEYAQRNMRKIGVDFPLVKFHEDEESLDGALTAVGCVLPDVMRDFKWDESRWNHFYGEFQGDQHDPDERNIPWECTTKAYFEHVSDKTELHNLQISRRAIDPKGMGYYKDYAYDNFLFVEFSDWMNRQRLA